MSVIGWFDSSGCGSIFVAFDSVGSMWPGKRTIAVAVFLGMSVLAIDRFASRTETRDTSSGNQRARYILSPLTNCVDTQDIR